MNSLQSQRDSRDMQRGSLAETLREVKMVFDKHSLEFWLDCGTLLGVVRDGKLIPWDSDIDLGMWEKDIIKVVEACYELQEVGFDIILGRAGIGLKSNSISIPVSILLYRVKGDSAVKEWGNYKVRPALRRFVDIFFWLFLTPQYGDVRIKGLRGAKNLARLILARMGQTLPESIKSIAVRIEPRLHKRYLSIVPKHYFMNLSKIEFYGTKFNIPSEVDNYLSYRYGKNWRVPDKGMGRSERRWHYFP